MWPKLAITRLWRRAMSSTERTITAKALRGTVTSSRTVVGLIRAKAEKAERRAVARRTASCSSAAATTLSAAWRRAISDIRRASSSTTEAGPSVSMSSKAPASVGRPMRAKSSTQRMVVWSRNSSVQGMIFAAMISVTVSAASSMRLNEASSVRRAAGFGIRRNSTLVMIPRVPSDPMKRSLSEYPATSFTHLLPIQTTSPLASTTSRPIT